MFTACGGNNSEVEDKLDSLGKKVDTTAEKMRDSTKAKAKKLKRNIKEELKGVKD